MRMGFLYLVLRLSFLFAFLHSVAGEVTHISFPYFTAEDNMMAFGDARHNIANRSYVMNADARMQTTGTCGELMYGNKVRIQDAETGKAASFSTSFSFTFTTPGLFRNDTTAAGNDCSGLAFMFIRREYFASMKEFLSERGWDSGCKTRSDPKLLYSPSSFVFIVDTDYNPKLKAPSNNYVRIGNLGLNVHYEHDPKSYLHNLCGNDTHCSYFVDGKIFTAWIDYSSSLQTLEVRLANGSSPSVKKPVKPLMLIPNYEMSKGLGDEVYLTFWGSSDANHVETHELLSWSFFSSGISESSIPSPRTLFRFLQARTWVGFTGGFFGIAAALVILWCISRFARSSRYHRYMKLKYSAGHHVFSYAELRKATQNFNERNLLGTGGSGSVYKGSKLEGPSGDIFVAVKQIHISESKQAEALFHAEVSSLVQIRHRNVLQLQGWCQEKDRLLLVYDYMPNGSLNEWLHKNSGRQQVLSLKMRHSILEGVGAALEYLHEDCHSCILHRDIKSSNVLLDADFNAHLGDFGLARLMNHHKVDKTTLAAGTLGYMAPEISYTGKATKESDVYSFGILVLEVVCGRRPLDMQALEPEDLVLLYVVWRAHEARSLLTMADPRLLQTLQPSSSTFLEDDECTYAIEPLSLPLDTHNSTENNKSISTIVDVDAAVHKTMVVNLLHLGLLCCLPNPKARPSMGQVNGILQQIRDMEDASAITVVAMPSLPATKPLGLYPSFEFSQTAVNSTSCVPSTISLSHSKSSPDNSTSQQSGGSLYKDD